MNFCGWNFINFNALQTLWESIMSRKRLVSEKVWDWTIRSPKVISILCPTFMAEFFINYNNNKTASWDTIKVPSFSIVYYFFPIPLYQYQPTPKFSFKSFTPKYLAFLQQESFWTSKKARKGSFLKGQFCQTRPAQHRRKKFFIKFNFKVECFRINLNVVGILSADTFLLYWRNCKEKNNKDSCF